MKIACVQMTSGPEIAENLQQAGDMVRQAAAAGAVFIATPENTDFIGENLRRSLETSRAEEEHPGLPFFSDLARELSIDLLIGSMKVRVGRKMANRSYLFVPDGEVKARYDKIHLFDVDLESGESHRESTEVEAGKEAVISEVQGEKIGLSICYDLRFAYLYRTLAKAGAKILTVPAAFTVPTGKAHWEVLLRARAIETGSFVIAPAQCGTHAGGRNTYGHSMIIGPWGQVIGALGDEPGILYADLDMDDVKKARTSIPALQHDRDFLFKGRHKLRN